MNEEKGYRITEINQLDIENFEAKVYGSDGNEHRGMVGKREGCRKLLLIASILTLLISFSGCGSNHDMPEMNHSVDANGNQVYDGDLQYFYQIEEGQKATCHIKVDAIEGSVSFTIHSENDESNIKYRGKITESCEFDVEIDEVNNYRIYVVADDFHGNYEIKWNNQKTEN